MSADIYSWAGDYFCPGCIVYEMVQHEPWCEWGEGKDLSRYSTSRALDRMSRELHLTTEKKEKLGFPELVTETNETIFCAICLNLLTPVP